LPWRESVGKIHREGAKDAKDAKKYVDQEVMPIQLTEKSGGVALAVKVVPGSSRNRIAGEYGGGIKVNVTQPPEGGAANRAVIALLSELLEIPAAGIRISRGQSSARKEVVITGLPAEVIASRLIGRG
jgi:hypothetical protein